ncbi:MFS transporter [Ruminococcus flavefaciens]|uniref:Glycoside/pentoside/hexuronide:cation symporter, GPH family n=1 Tax=Ruminococcus flavefaciens TaxID=1265 RepID=A0A1M7HZG6_RUMFL|nr:MFS transporter [Ruminococcus flavefaciens]SHM33922.1 glycoside/pentoside/hexuronide:cation symporter, GPH family [Ruminococcus flavefaciens]
MENKKTASNKILWIFAVGQLGWSILAGIISNWLVFFYQPSQEELAKGQTALIPQGTFIGLTVIGVITAVGRIFDAVTDPFIAGKSDSLKHRLGRRIPFMRFAAIPFGIVTVLMFISPFEAGSKGNVACLFIFAMLFYFCMTCYCTPYNALIPELGSTQNARINLSTYISVTYFFGTGIAFFLPSVAGIFTDSLGYANSYRVSIAILAAIAIICMLIPAFLIDENVYVDTTPSKSSAFSSLLSTFRNKDFRIFVCSDILYWIGLTLFQTGLSFYVTVLLGLDTQKTSTLFIIMTVSSLAFYPAVNIFSKKLGKKKLISFAFLFFSVAFIVTAGAGLFDIPAMAYGVIIAVLAALPMAILGILPQAVVADISEEDKLETGESRQGMFYAARTFAFKMGQSLAMLLFTSIALVNSDVKKGQSGYGLGYRLTAVVAAVLCLLGGLVFLKYNEKKVLKRIGEGQKDA